MVGRTLYSKCFHRYARNDKVISRAINIKQVGLHNRSNTRNIKHRRNKQSICGIVMILIAIILINCNFGNIGSLIILYTNRRNHNINNNRNRIIDHVNNIINDVGHMFIYGEYQRS